MRFNKYVRSSSKLVMMLVIALSFGIIWVNAEENVLLSDDFEGGGPLDTSQTWEMTQGSAPDFHNGFVANAPDRNWNSRKDFGEPISVTFSGVFLNKLASSDNNHLGLAAEGLAEDMVSWCFEKQKKLVPFRALDGTGYWKEAYENAIDLTEYPDITKEGGTGAIDLRIDWWPGKLVRYYLNDKLIAEYTEHVMSKPSPVGVRDESVYFRINSIKVTALSEENPETEKIAAAGVRIQAITEQYRGLRMVLACPGKDWGIDAQITDELKKSGVEVLAYPDAPDISRHEYSFDNSDARLYNILVFGDTFYGTSQPDSNTGEMPEGIRNQIPVLRHFLEQGGGIWFSGLSIWDYGRSALVMNYILKELGLEAEVVNEVVNDSAGTINFKFNRYNWSYAWAEIMPDPLTKGLKGLWHPSGIIGNMCSMGVVPITRLSSDWRVLVRGMPTAASYGCDLKSPEGSKFLNSPGIVKSSPVLCAVRQVGKGRVVLWPTWSNFTVIGGSGGMLLDAKRNGRRSDGARLIENLLCWLAEPNQGSKTVGQFNPEKDRVPPPQYNVDQELKNWSQPGRMDYGNQYKGLIGIHSNLSDGKSSPEEMIASARDAGYDFIAFTEELTKMNEKKWKEIIDICDKANAGGPNFIAYPGLDFLDEAGNRGVVFGQRYWIKDDWWSKDKPGRIKYWHAFSYSADAEPSNWFPRVIIRSKTNNKRPWNQGLWSFFAPYCYEAGKLVDDSFVEWRRVIGRHVFFLNAGIMAVHTVHSAHEIAESAEKRLFQTYVRSNGLPQILERIRGHIGAETDYFPSYISSGPEILDFKIHGFQPRWEGIDCAIPGNNRALLHILLQSKTGLKDVSVYDGERLVRRFCPEGNEFETFMTFHPDSYHAYSLTVTDRDGNQAISWPAWVQVQDNVHRRSGDNWNWMRTGKYNMDKVLAKPVFNLLEITQGWMSQTMEEKKVVARPTYECEQAYYSHGGMSAAINGYMSPELLVDDNLWDAWYPVMTMDFATLGRYGAILTNTVREDYVVRKPDPYTIGCYAGPYKVVPSPWPADLKQYVIHRRADGAKINRYQGKVTFTKKVSTLDDKPVRVSLGSGDRGLANTLEVMNPDGTSERHQVNASTLTGNIPVNGYISWYDEKGDGVGGIIALSPGIEYSYSRGSQQCFISVPSPVKPGTEVNWDVIFVNGSFETSNSNSQMEDVRLGMGISGKPTLYNVESQVGKVADQKFFLTLEAKDNGFSGSVVKTTGKLLPIHLPVFIRGLNPRWDAGIWYRDKTNLEFVNYYHNLWGGRSWNVVADYEPRVDEIQYIPVSDDGVGYCQVDTDRQEPDVFIGNLLVCDKPEVFLTLIEVNRNGVKFEINNPTDKPVTVTVHPSKGFELVGDFAETVSLPAGGFKTVTIGF